MPAVLLALTFVGSNWWRFGSIACGRRMVADPMTWNSATATSPADAPSSFSVMVISARRTPDTDGDANVRIAEGRREIDDARGEQLDVVGVEQLHESGARSHLIGDEKSVARTHDLDFCDGHRDRENHLHARDPEQAPSP